MLAEFLGGTVRVRPSPDRTHLIARVGMSPIPLLRAAGMTKVDKVVAGAGFDLYIEHPLAVPIVSASLSRCLR